MAKQPKAPKPSASKIKSVDAIKHDGDKRKNIPTAEFQSVIKTQDETPVRVTYPRNRDLDLLRRTRESLPASDRAQQTDLFADFNGIAKDADKTEFYQHDQNWSNRMILGDSLQVMASLAEREGLRGKVQCIYFDPPYGIKFT